MCSPRAGPSGWKSTCDGRSGRSTSPIRFARYSRVGDLPFPLPTWRVGRCGPRSLWRLPLRTGSATGGDQPDAVVVRDHTIGTRIRCECRSHGIDRGVLLGGWCCGKEVADERYGAYEGQGVLDIVPDAHGYGQVLDGDIGEPGDFEDATCPVRVGKPERSGRAGGDTLRHADVWGCGCARHHDPFVAVGALRGGEREAATRAQRAGQIREAGVRIVEVHEAVAADHHVEAAVPEWMHLGVRLDELNVVCSRGRGSLTSQGEQWWWDVDADRGA